MCDKDKNVKKYLLQKLFTENIEVGTKIVSKEIALGNKITRKQNYLNEN